VGQLYSCINKCRYENQVQKQVQVCYTSPFRAIVSYMCAINFKHVQQQSSSLDWDDSSRSYRDVSRALWTPAYYEKLRSVSWLCVSCVVKIGLDAAACQLTASLKLRMSGYLEGRLRHRVTPLLTFPVFLWFQLIKCEVIKNCKIFFETGTKVPYDQFSKIVSYAGGPGIRSPPPETGCPYWVLHGFPKSLHG
jgi:hypothetical protein